MYNVQCVCNVHKKLWYFNIDTANDTDREKIHIEENLQGMTIDKTILS